MRLLAGLLRGRDDTVIPAVCYDVCNDAYLEAVSVGKTPALCQANSAFQVSLQGCEACITTNSASGADASKTYINSKLGQFIDYCAAAPAESQASTASQVAPTTSAFSSRPPPPSYTIPTSWLTSTVLTLTTSLLDVNGNKSITATLTPVIVYTRPDWTGFLTSTPTQNTTSTPTSPTSPAPVSSTPPPAASPPDANRAWIAGPVVGSVAGLVLIALAVAFFLRRRKRMRGGGPSYTGEPELQGDNAYNEYKPPQQLHADPANYHELDAAQQWEMPANEVAAREMAAREAGVWRPSEGVVPDQNQAVYLGTDQAVHTGYDQGLHAGYNQTIDAAQEPAVYSGHEQAAYSERAQAANPGHDQVDQVAYSSGHNQYVFPTQGQTIHEQ